MSVEIATATAIKFLASLCGAAIGLALLAPADWREFWRRLVLSVLSGMSFWSVTYEFITGNSWWQASRSPDTYWFSIVITAALSWWVLGAIARAVNLWKGPEKK